MQATWKTRASLAGFAVAIGVVFVLSSAPSKGVADHLETQIQQPGDRPPMGHSQHDPNGPPNEDTHTVVFLRSTAGGGAVFKGLGTVSHASIDNRFISVLEAYGNYLQRSTTPRLEVHRSGSR